MKAANFCFNKVLIFILFAPKQMETIQKYFSEDFSVFSVSPRPTSINLSKKKKNHAQKSVCFKSEEIITIKKLVKTDIFQRIKPHDAYIS